jgi:hypothetical protein
LAQVAKYKSWLELGNRNGELRTHPKNTMWNIWVSLWFTILAGITIRKCDFSEGLIWLKYPHWPRGMVILTKGPGHEKHELLMIKTFD